MAGPRVVHVPTDADDGTDERVLATEVEIADTALTQAKGLMFRSELPAEFALVLEVGDDKLFPIPRGPPRHVVHMLFVRVPLDVIFIVDDEVTKVARMQPWRSLASGKADRILELPAGNADGVEPGDVVRVDESEDNEPSEIEAESA